MVCELPQLDVPSPAACKQDKHTFYEMRLSVYGRKRDEWSKLAKWVTRHGMLLTHNRWMIQIPRLYVMWKKNAFVGSFDDVLKNIFMPLWDVTLDPTSDPTGSLDHFLRQMSGFDCVDNESQPDPPLEQIPPSEWTE
eukprot:gene8811-6810_t